MLDIQVSYLLEFMAFSPPGDSIHVLIDLVSLYSFTPSLFKPNIHKISEKVTKFHFYYRDIENVLLGSIFLILTE